MKFNEVLSRITGLSIPVFGMQWNPPEAERAVARRVLAFLEDRRVLYNPTEMEMPGHCVASVQRIREFLTSEIGKLDADKEIAQSLRAMRAACLKFMNTVGVDDKHDRHIIMHGAERGHWANWTFNGAVGELRGVFGVHVAALAASYGLDVQGELASILPAKVEE